MHRSSVLSMLVVVPLAITPVRGQILHAIAPLPTFEVVTVKPWKRPPAPTPPPPSLEGPAAPVPVLPAKIAPGQSFGQKTDRVHSILPVQLLIAFAYNLPFGSESRVTGGPDWVKTDQYEIQGKIDEAQFATMLAMTPRQQTEQVNLMEQALLRDRFDLNLHFETREKTVFALVIAKGGPKLTQASEGEPTKLSMLGNEITAKAVTIEQLSHAPFLGARTVVNQTGLTGAYDFTLTWTDQAGATDNGTDLPSFSTALQEQLGLKLVPMKAQVEVIVVDHIERPAEN